MTDAQGFIYGFYPDDEPERPWEVPSRREITIMEKRFLAHNFTGGLLVTMEIARQNYEAELAQEHDTRDEIGQ